MATPSELQTLTRAQLCRCDHLRAEHVDGHGCAARLDDKSECECNGFVAASAESLEASLLASRAEADALAARATTPTEDDALADINNALQILEEGRVNYPGPDRYYLDSTAVRDIRDRLSAAQMKLERAKVRA